MVAAAEWVSKGRGEGGQWKEEGGGERLREPTEGQVEGGGGKERQRKPWMDRVSALLPRPTLPTPLLAGVGQGARGTAIAYCSHLYRPAGSSLPSSMPSHHLRGSPHATTTLPVYPPHAKGNGSGRLREEYARGGRRQMGRAHCRTGR